MKILFVTPRLPVPPNRGDRLRYFHFARVLSKKHSLSLLSFIQSEKEMTHVPDLKEYFDDVETVLLKPWQSYRSMLLGLFSKTPLQVFYFHSKEMQRRIQEVLKRDNFDVIYTFHLRMAPYAKKIRGAYRVLDLTDAVSLFLERMLRHRSVFLRPILYREYLTVKRYESLVVGKFDECWLISTVDKDAMNLGNGVSKIFLVPNGIDVDYFKPSEPRPASNSILFVGYMGIESVDAVSYFYKDIFPLVRKEIPSAKFYVVGADPPGKIVKLARDKNVIVTGFVKDLRDYYNKAAVVVVPMKFVVGVQNKVLEAMAMKLPVVTSSLGNEGIDASPGKEIFVEDEPNAFANRVVEILKNEHLRMEIGSNARSFVERKFAWANVLDRMNEIHSKISRNQMPPASD